MTVRIFTIAVLLSSIWSSSLFSSENLPQFENPGFESGEAGWRYMIWSGGNYGTGEFSQKVAPNGRTGGSALQITGKNVSKPAREPGRFGVYSIRKVSLPAGNYNLSGFYRLAQNGKLPAPGKTVNVWVQGTRAEADLPPTKEWTRFDCPFILSAETEIGVMLRMYCNGAVLFDDIAIEPYKKCSSKIATVFPAKAGENFAIYPANLAGKVVGDNLVFSLEMQHPDISLIECAAKTSQDKVWEDESVELFFNPTENPDTENYIRLVINADGVVLARQGKSQSFSGDISGIKVETAKYRKNNCWRMRLTVPTAVIDKQLEKDETWGFNFLHTVRIGRAEVETSSWSYLELSAHEPVNFGSIRRNGNEIEFLQTRIPRISSRLANNGFEKQNEGLRWATWQNGDYGKGNFSSEFSNDSIEGTTALVLHGRGVENNSSEASRGGFWLPATGVEIAGEYSLSGYYRFIPEGKFTVEGKGVSVYAAGGGSEIFLPPSTAWRHFDCRFTLKEAKTITPLLRIWCNGTVYFDALDISPYEPPAALLEAGSKSSSILKFGDKTFIVEQNEIEKQCKEAGEIIEKDGLVVFTREVRLLQPDSTPVDKQEIVSELSVRSAKGGRETNFLALCGEGKWKVSLEPTENSRPLPENFVSFFRVPFWMQRTSYEGLKVKEVAEVLYPLGDNESIEVDKDRIAVLAMRFTVPANAEAGEYKSVAVFSDGAREVKIPLSCVVEDFTLPEAETGFGMWVEKPDEKAWKFCAENGIRYSTFQAPIKITKTSYGKINADTSKAIEMFRKYEKAGMRFPVPLELSKLSSDLARTLGIYEKLPKDPVRDSVHLICPRSEEEYPKELTEAFTEAVRQISEQLSKAGLADKVYYYPVDEPTINNHRLFKMYHEAGIIKKIVKGAKFWTTVHDRQKTEKLVKDGILHCGTIGAGALRRKEFAESFYAMASRNNLELWTYSGSWPENYERTRMMSVFFATQPKVKRLFWYVAFWATANAGDEMNDLRNKFKACATFYPTHGKSEDNFYSTIEFEGLRDGITDAAYYTAFINSLKKLPQEKARQLQSKIDNRITGMADSPSRKELDLIRKLLIESIVMTE